MDIIRYKNNQQTTVDINIYDFKRIEFEKIEKYWTLLCDPSITHARTDISQETRETIRGFLNQSNNSKKRHGNTLVKIRCMFAKIQHVYCNVGFEMSCSNSFDRLICYTLSKTLGFNTEVLTREEMTKVSADSVYKYGGIKNAIKNNCTNICPEKEYVIRDTEWEYEQKYYIIRGHIKYGLKFTVDQQNRQDSMFLLLSRSKPFSDLGRDVLKCIVVFI